MPKRGETSSPNGEKKHDERGLFQGKKKVQDMKLRTCAGVGEANHRRDVGRATGGQNDKGLAGPAQKGKKEINLPGPLRPEKRDTSKKKKTNFAATVELNNELVFAKKIIRPTKGS